MERIKYNIKGVNSIEDIKDKKDFYKVANHSGAVYIMDHDFIEKRFRVMQFEKEKYFCYMDNPYTLNGIFGQVGTTDRIDIDLQLVEVK